MTSPTPDREGEQAFTAGPWADVEADVAAAVQRACEPAVKKVCDDIYDRLLGTVQEYVQENLRWNVAETLRAARDQAHHDRERAQAAERTVDNLAGVLREGERRQRQFQATNAPEMNAWGDTARAAIARALGGSA